MYTDSFKVASNYFPPNFYWIPTNPVKNLKFYFGILLQTESLIIKPIFDKSNKTKIIYYSAYILNVIIEENWGTLYTSKKPPQSNVVY